MFTIYPPQTLGEMLAWSSAIITIIFGLICLVTPRLAFKIMRLRTEEGIPQAVSESRATMSGFYLGTGILAILFNQPFVWMVLGAGWAFTAFGRFVSMIFDRGFTQFNLISIVIEAALAVLPLIYALGIVR